MSECRGSGVSPLCPAPHRIVPLWFAPPSPAAPWLRIAQCAAGSVRQHCGGDACDAMRFCACTALASHPSSASAFGAGSGAHTAKRERAREMQGEHGEQETEAVTERISTRSAGVGDFAGRSFMRTARESRNPRRRSRPHTKRRNTWCNELCPTGVCQSQIVFGRQKSICLVTMALLDRLARMHPGVSERQVLYPFGKACASLLVPCQIT